MSVTRFGVSLVNVVATIESPASHHGTGAARREELRRVAAGPPAEEERRDEADRERDGDDEPVDGLEMHGLWL